jgi:hypothetical protein
MGIKYTNIFHCKTVQHLPKLGFLGLKICHLVPLALNNCLKLNKYHKIGGF